MPNLIKIEISKFSIVILIILKIYFCMIFSIEKAGVFTASVGGLSDNI